MKRFWEIIRNFSHLTAFKLGCLLTASFMAIAFQFYTGHGNPWLLERLQEIHQKTIDIRLRDRGTRAPSSNIAIVAVDEISEQKLGRWPWPRGKIAEIIDLLVSYGAKVVAFDAVFVETDRNQAVVSLTQLKQSKLANPELAEMIDQELRNANTDWILAKTVEKHSDHLVMGSYYDERVDSYLPYQEYCGAMLSAEAPWYPKLEKEEKPVIISDSVGESIPEQFQTILKAVFKEIEKNTTVAWGNKNPEDLLKTINEAQSAYCDRWLLRSGPNTDEFFDRAGQMWTQLRSSAPGWENLNYEEAALRVEETFLANKVHRTGRWWLNLPIITEGTKHTAYFNATLDSDGTVRRSGLVVRNGGLMMSSLALKSVLVANDWNVMVQLDADPTDISSKIISKLTLIDSEGNEVGRIPVDGTGRLLINYAGDEKTYPHVSVAELFNKSDKMNISVRRDGIVTRESVDKTEFFKNKILIFGATSTGTYDLRVTPFSENYPGVETHANLIDNIQSKNFLVSHHDEGPKMLLVLAVMGLTLSFGIAHLGAIQGFLLANAALFGIYLVDRYYFFANGIIVNVVLPLMLVSLTYVLMTFYKYLTEERKKKAIKGTFEKYVSPAIVAEVLKHPDNVGLGGKKQRMTVLFSDLRGFTTISEKLDPQVLVEVLNEYLTPMTALVFKNQGTLDKYMGDAIMSFFGAPIYYGDHAKKACQCAIEMIELLPKINADFKANGLPQIDVGIGINTGDMSVGNMGSETVRNYTVMGDAVNLGSRLEGINKQYGTRIIISEYTYEEVKDEYVAREIDWVRVKGKRQPVKIFELIAHKSKFKNIDLVEEFKKGFEAYHQRRWDSAIDFFTKALNHAPNDAASRLYVERSQEYKTNPPPEDWDGVYEMKTK